MFSNPSEEEIDEFRTNVKAELVYSIAYNLRPKILNKSSSGEIIESDEEMPVRKEAPAGVASS